MTDDMYRAYYCDNGTLAITTEKERPQGRELAPLQSVVITIRYDEVVIASVETLNGTKIKAPVGYLNLQAGNIDN